MWRRAGISAAMEPPESVSLGTPWFERASFCLLCGAPMEIRHVFGQDRPACTRCEFILFRNPASGAAALVVRGREVLLVKRGIRPYLGHWGLPAGFQEYGESADAAAIRETREETGLDIEIVRLFSVHYTRDDPRKEANLIVYLARAVGGTLQAADDAADAKFWSLDELPEQIAFTNNRTLLDELRQQFPSGDIE